MRVRRTGACNVTFDNVSFKPVNDKHHATTVFYGDMYDLLTSAQKTALAASLSADDEHFNFNNGTTSLVTGDATGFTASNATFANAS